MSAEPRRTRVAVLTPMAPAGIAVIQMIGPAAGQILDRVFHPSQGSQRVPTGPDRLRLGQLRDGADVIDDALVAVRDAQAAGQVVEINTHGSVRAVQRTLSALQRHGAVLEQAHKIAAEAWPSQDLIDQEAIDGLGRATTRRAVRWLACQRVALSAHLRSLGQLLNASTGQKRDEHLAKERTAAVRDALRQLLASFEPGQRLLHGANVALVGPPNAGKSTLVNRLFGQPRSVVTDREGTTRDWVAEPTGIQGVPVTLIDTAGVRHPGDALECEAIERSMMRAEQADVLLLVLDASRRLPPDIPLLLHSLQCGHPTLVVLNKIDLGQAVERREVVQVLGSAGRDEQVVSVSALKGDQVPVLAAAVLRAMGFADWDDQAPALFTTRQRRAIEAALSAVSDNPQQTHRRLHECLFGPLAADRA